MKGYEPQRCIDVNMGGSLNVLEYSVKINASIIVTTQSISDIAYLYGLADPISADAERKFPLNNDHSAYSITKTTVKSLRRLSHRKVSQATTT